LIVIVPHHDGSVLAVLAQPGSKRQAILGERAGALRVAVTSPPENGKANQAIQSLLAEALGCKQSRIRLISGTTARRKRFLFDQMTPADLADRIAAVIRKSESPPK
jgi:uncharacterized protein (TIGR00251 family)